ncbi:hypothetical protein [Streptomyces lydicus]|uniref:hypothetical protein n=1 Tax=Streptomyces lydicus TaxID=47763 RepID=UPI0013E91F50|nr:hypothetical protein [Streptomyces lydicus]
MTAGQQPAAPSAEARELLAEAAKDYAKAKKLRCGLDHRDDAGVRSRANEDAGAR